ncbi:type II secretion system F family protein [Microbacterium aurantiacum]|uniref:type II secretion system F family protein n=1 Tax=Microbacterium aurantiacum TaxID=162393 RepID=UPI003F491ADB
MVPAVTPRPMAAGEAVPAAESVLQLAVLLRAGIAPRRAWEYLAGTGDPGAARVVAAVAAGSPLPHAIREAGVSAGGTGRRRGHRRRRRGTEAGEWREVGAAWQVATVVGAPLAESLRGLADALRDARAAADDVRIALAEPAGTARLLAWLPIVAVVLGALLGFDTLGILFSHPLGVACLVLGGLLIVLAHRWTMRLVRAATGDDAIPGHRAELLAIALSGGVSIDRALTLVARARPEPPEDAAQGPSAPPRDDIDAVLALSRTAGVPAVDLLRAWAVLARHRARVDGRLRAARLSTRLLLPLGVCTLPAFLLLGVAPMLLSVVRTMPFTL